LVKAACTGQIDAITFTSAPGVHNLFAMAGTAEEIDRLRAALNGPVAAACGGPVCAEGARLEGVVDPLTPSVGRLDLLVRALGDHLSGTRQCYRLAGHEVTVQGGAIELDGAVDQLAPKERAIWELLIRKPGAVVARETFLLGVVWGCPDTDPHLLEVAIGRL
jgi:uroporphyrinogen-III synthase